MKDLETATNYKFEKLYTVYENTTPTPATGNYEFIPSQGTIAQPTVVYSWYTNIKGTIHSHYEGLLSIYSPQDLQDIYLMLKNPDVTLDFFSGLVTKAGTRYVITIADKAKFMAFGDKYLSTKRNLEDFVVKFYYGKYNIYENGNNDNNEKGFVKMMTDLDAGINAFKGNSDFTDWQRLILTPTTNQVTPVSCN